MEKNKLIKTLLRNLYPKRLIGKCIKMYLDNKYVKDNKQQHSIEIKEIKYVTLPYIGKVSDFAKKKIYKLISKFCNHNLQIRLVFNTSKLKS